MTKSGVIVQNQLPLRYSYLSLVDQSPASDRKRSFSVMPSCAVEIIKHACSLPTLAMTSAIFSYDVIGVGPYQYPGALFSYRKVRFSLLKIGRYENPVS